MELTPKMIAFRRSDDARTELARLLNEPALKQAIEVIREAGIPKSIPQLDSRNHPDTVVAHKFHEMVGINSALDALSRLTLPMNEHPDDHAEEEPFSHTLPKHLQKLPTFTK
jgi:hypothetical protein